jgi:ammonium transporter, Amt family
VWSAAIFGGVSAIFVMLLKKESSSLLRHDKLQVFAVHAGGGLAGMCLTGVLAEYVGIADHEDCPT